MDASEWMPAGFVPLAHFDHRSRGRGDGHSPEYKQLREAFRQRKIPGLQTGGERGRVYVHEQSAKQYLADNVLAEAAKFSEPEPASPSPSADNAIAALTAVLSALATSQMSLVAEVERIATAVESIATQPKTPPQGLAHEMSGYGFHS
jgi:hypothetical protein